MAGGDAAGTARELASKAGATEEQAVSAGRDASVLPAIIGGLPRPAQLDTQRMEEAAGLRLL